MRSPRPEWAQVYLATVMAMIRSKMGARDPCAAVVASFLEIGDAMHDVMERNEAASDKTIESWDRSLAALQVTMKTLSAQQMAAAEMRDRKLSKFILVAIVVAMAVISAVCWSGRGGNVCAAGAAGAPAADAGQDVR